MTTKGKNAKSGELTREIQLLLRDLTGRLRQLNDAVGSHLELRATDIEVIDLVARHGPLSPGDLSVTTGIHPATLTGILDRLERGGWVSRVPDPGDRRKVQLEVRRDRAGEMVRLYGPMNRSITSICAGLDPEQLSVIRDFLRAAAAAGVDAASVLRDDASEGGDDPPVT